MTRPDAQRRKALQREYARQQSGGTSLAGWLTHPLLWALVVPLAVTAWRALGLGYTAPELLANLAQDLIVTAVLVLVVLVNPLKHPLGYRGLWLALCVAYLTAEPPQSGADWFGAIVALLLVGEAFPRLHRVVPLVALGLWAGYFIVIAAMAPLMDRDAAAEVLSRDHAGAIGGAFLHGATGADRFATAIQSARWYLLADGALSDRIAATRALHRAMRDRLDAAGLSYLEWDTLPSRVVDRPAEGRLRVRLQGRVAGYLDPDAPAPLGGTVPAQGRLSHAVAVDVAPFELTLARGADGHLRVEAFPTVVAFELARPSP